MEEIFKKIKSIESLIKKFKIKLLTILNYGVIKNLILFHKKNKFIVLILKLISHKVTIKFKIIN